MSLMPCALLILGLAGGAGIVQETAAPAKTGRISGVVVAGDTGRPLAGALVSLTFHGSGGVRQSAMTDASGAFDFASVPAGTFTLRAGHARYVEWSYGQRESDHPAVHTLREGQYLQAQLVLPKVSAIDGRVIDPFGDPVAGVGVFVFTNQDVHGSDRIVAARRRTPPQTTSLLSARALTDDLGQFRVSGLAPGDYYLAALSGVLTASPLFNVPNESAGFAPTYFPGTPSIAEAQRLSLGPSQEVNDVTIALVPASMRRISGVAIDSTGAPLARALMSLSPVDQGSVAISLAGRTQALEDGKFAFSNVPPGVYVLQARSLGTTDAFNGEFGWTTVTMTGVDVTDVGVSTFGPSSLRGRLLFDGEETLRRKPYFGTQIAVPPAEVDKEPVIAIATGDPAVDLDASGAFEVKHLWGRRLIRLRRAPDGWRLERVTIDAKDITDVPIDFTGRSYTNAEIVLTNQSASVAGRVVDREKRPPIGARVVVFAADREQWTPHSRFVAVAAVASDGAFDVRGLPPGEYLAMVVPHGVVAPARAAFLESIRDQAVPLSLPAGLTQGVELAMRDR